MTYQPPPPYDYSSSSSNLPALGTSLAGAAICAAVFLGLALLNLMDYKYTKYRIHFIFTMSCIVRGIGLIEKASSAHSGSSSTWVRLVADTNVLFLDERGQAIIYFFFMNSGFGLAIGMQALSIAGWFKNTNPAIVPAPASFWQHFMIALFPINLVFGPVLGLTAGLLLYLDNPTQSRINAGNNIRKAAYSGLLGVSCLLFLGSLYAILTAKSRAGLYSKDGRYAPHSAILIVLVAAPLLIWCAAAELAGIVHNDAIFTDDKLYFTLVVLPQMLHAALWTIPSLMVRVHLSSRFSQWWAELHPGVALPLTGNFDDSEAATQGPYGPGKV